MAKVKTPSTKATESNLLKSKIENSLSPWSISRWRSTDFGYSFTVTISDTITEKKVVKQKELLSFLLLLSAEDAFINIKSENLIEWANSEKPVMLFYTKEEKLHYLFLSQHYLNTLFSENPSLSARDIIQIPASQFIHFQKNKVKEIKGALLIWARMNFAVLESGTYFAFKDSLKTHLDKTLLELRNLSTDLELDALEEIGEAINRAIYTVAIVGPTKAGKSTIINSLVSKHVSPINIRPTTGIPTSIVPGTEEKTEILMKDDRVISGPAEVSFLNQYVAIDENKGNHKGVKMVTVWIKSSQMEKGLSFCDFPGLDDPDLEIEKTVQKALEFVNAIIYVIDASGMENGFKFPKHYRDDLNSLKDKDKIFLVINKVDVFSQNEALFSEFKRFIDEQLEELGLISFLPHPPIYMSAKRIFENRQKGIYENDEMQHLETLIWNHLLANSKSGLHNLINISNSISQESERLNRALNTRKLDGERQAELRLQLNTTESELAKISSFAANRRYKISEGLRNTVQLEKDHVTGHFRSYLNSISQSESLPNDNQIREYLMDQFAITAPTIFEQLELEVTHLHNELNQWVNEKLQSIEIIIDSYTKQQFLSSESYNQLIMPISHIFSESYGRNVPTGMLSNIFYHIFTTLGNFGDWIEELLTDKTVVRNRKINGIMKKVEVCYNEIFNRLYLVFDEHQKQKCNLLVDKVRDRTNIYINNIKKQIQDLNNPLSQTEKKIFDLAGKTLEDLDLNAEAVRLQIEEFRMYLKPVPTEEEKIAEIDTTIDVIEREIRKLLNSILTKEMGTTVARKIVPGGLHQKICDRIEKSIKDHPNTSDNNFTSFESWLQFFDMQEYVNVITNSICWEHVKIIFNSKDNVTKHFNQLSSLRNTIRHSREMTELILAEGQASIVWFKMALKI